MLSMVVVALTGEVRIRILAWNFFVTYTRESSLIHESNAILLLTPYILIIYDFFEV